MRPTYHRRVELVNPPCNLAPNMARKNERVSRTEYDSTSLNQNSTSTQSRTNTRVNYSDYEAPLHKQRLKKVYYHPSIEHARKSSPAVFKAANPEYRKFLRELPIKQQMYFMLRQPYVPTPGYVHVRLFNRLDNLPERFWLPVEEAVLPLEPDGGLDLISIKRLWNQDFCIPISPCRFKPVEPTTPDSLSPIAVMTLLEFFGCITFIDCQVPMKKPTYKERVKEVLRPVVQAGHQQLVKTIDHPIVSHAQNKAGYLALQLKWRLQAALSSKSSVRNPLLAFVGCALPFVLFSVFSSL